MMMEKGRKLGDVYTLVDEIGSGGGGVVYKAYHERLQIYVVVKKMKDQVKGILDGRTEVNILKNMKHTCLPRVYDFMEIDGGIYTVMDYIPGRSFDKELAERGHFSQKQVLEWAEQLAEALAYLHSQKPPVIHSDIKPANIMLTPEGKICLIDFNISLAFDSGMRTSTGISGGYSPPEQYRDVSAYRKYAQAQKPLKTVATMTAQSAVTETTAPATVTETAAPTAVTETAAPATVTETAAPTAVTEAAPATVTETAAPTAVTDRTWGTTESIVERMVGRGVDERSDIYSLGATLYHLVTGRKPDSNFEEILPIEQYDAALSEGFIHILKKMMALEPEDRYQNGRELLYALHHIYELDDEFQTYQKRCRNQKRIIALLYICGAAALGSGWSIRQRELDTEYSRDVEQAAVYMEAGELQEASLTLTEAVNIRPERIEAYSNEAVRLYRTGDYEGCIRYAVDILQNPPYLVKDEDDQKFLGDIYYVLGNCYIEKEAYPDAEHSIEKAILQYSRNSLYYRDLAISMAKQGKVGEAESVLDQAIVLHLGEDSIYMVQGEIAFVKGEYEETEACLLKAVPIAADEDLRRRAVLLCDRTYRELGTGYLDKEIAFLEQEENRGGAPAAYISERLADAYARKAASDEAVSREYYKKSIERFEYLYENGYATRQIMENIAILHEQTGDYGKAEDMLQQMLIQYPENYECYKRLAFFEADKQQNAENQERDYHQMKMYYDRAKELYGERSDDLEMQMLDNLITDLQEGNWL